MSCRLLFPIQSLVGRKGLFHTSSASSPLFAAAAAVAVEKSVLAKLRKSTGYSFTRCKEALEKHDNDLKAAEDWLRAEAQTHGWEKATKLQGRATAQGLISVLASPKNAVMLEVNCETDFVARNKKFQGLVQRLTQACFQKCEGEGGGAGGVIKNPVDADQLGSIPLQQQSIKDEIALAIGEIGENIKGRRALLFKSSEPSVFLAGYTHPASTPGSEAIQFGKFGAIVAFKSLNGDGGVGGKLAEIGRQLCQHIVGMNPTDIGSMDAPPPKRKEPVAPPPPPPPSDPTEPVDELDNALQIQRAEDIEDETTLLNQEFLLDPELTVRDFLIQNSVEVLDFVRFECGENL